MRTNILIILGMITLIFISLACSNTREPNQEGENEIYNDTLTNPETESDSLDEEDEIHESVQGVFDYGKFMADSTAYTFNDINHIMNKPSFSSEVVQTISIGSPVKIIRESESDSINKINSLWYEVEYIEKGKTKNGYIWGGNLSIATIKKDKDTCFIYGLSSIEGYEVFGKIKAVVNKRTVAESEQKAINSGYDQANNYNYTVSAKLLDGKFFSAVQNIIQLSFNYDACGYNFGDILIFWDGKKLYNGIEVTGVSEAGIFQVYSKAIYPVDRQGKKDKLIVKVVSKEFDEEDEDYVKKETIYKEYKWTPGSGIKDISEKLAGL